MSSLPPIPAAAAVPSTLGESFQFPQYYNWPPFFTAQPNPEVFERQLNMWLSLINDYCRATKTYYFPIPASNAGLFTNAKINRTLQPDFLQHILRNGRKTGLLSWSSDKSKLYVMWNTVEQWAEIILKWVTATGSSCTVLTGYEVRCGDMSTKYEFFEMDEYLFRKVLVYLEKTGKLVFIGGSTSKGGGESNSAGSEITTTDGLGFKFTI